MKSAIGIDLGTTFSAVAVMDESGRPKILPNRDGQPITPSVIYFSSNGPLVGDEAKKMQALGETDTASFFKRNMGDPNFILHFQGRDYTAGELSALVLTQLKADAEQILGLPVADAVITVPAYFNNKQREATIEAGRMAGLNVLRIINEPTAAALAYGFKEVSKAQTLLVYDLGGGTFDVTIVRVSKDDIEVLATAGDHELGGKDWDDRIVRFLAGQFQESHGVNPLDESVSANDLLVRGEIAKKELSTRGRTRLSITHEGERETCELSREQFEDLTRDLMERTQRLCEQTLADVKLNWRAMDGVLLVGGSTRMPMVRQYVEQMSGQPPLMGVNVDEAVALGAAIQAGMDMAESQGARPHFSLTGIKKVSDVMSHSLGMISENADQTRYINSIIIPKNKIIPCEETRPFQIRTRARGGNSVEVYMLQGESEHPLSCTVLGKYTFSNIQHVSSGAAILDIQYAYDRNGVVTVSATQQGWPQSLPLTIEALPADMSWAGNPVDNSSKQPAFISVVMAIDLSGSMSGGPLAAAQKAAKTFLAGIDLNHSAVALLGFADTAEFSQKLSSDKRTLEKGIDLWTDWMSKNRVGGGNDGEPFTEALGALRKAEGNCFLIVLTDGCWSHQERAIDRAKKCHAEDIEVIAMGFGGANQAFLQAIATSDENALFTSLGDLSSSFSKIAQVITDSGGGLRSEGTSGRRGLFK